MATSRPGDTALSDSVGTTVATTVTTDTARAARLTATEYAIAGDWVAELGDVLDALGLRGATE